MGSNIIAGLDVGTTKVCAVVAEMNGKGVNILGVGFVAYTAASHSNRIFSPEVLNGVFGRIKDWIKVYSDRLFKVR